VIDDGAGQAIWVGGLTSSGVYANRVGVLDTNIGAYHAVTVDGDAVHMPAMGGSAFDPRRHRAIVLGGTIGSGGDLDQVFAVTLSGDRAHVSILPNLPDAVISSPAAAYDPIHDRLVVVGFLSGGPPDVLLAARATVSLDLTPGAERWTQLLPPESGPTPALPGEGGWMAYDPATRQFVLVRSGNRNAPPTVWTLDASAPVAWQLAGSIPVAMNGYLLGGPVVDPGSCGMLLLANDGQCGFQLWWLGLTGGFALEMRGDVSLPRGTDRMGYGAVVFSAARDLAMVVRGGSCLVSDHWLDSAVQIPLIR